MVPRRSSGLWFCKSIPTQPPQMGADDRKLYSKAGKSCPSFHTGRQQAPATENWRGLHQQTWRMEKVVCYCIYQSGQKQTTSDCQECEFIHANFEASLDRTTTLFYKLCIYERRTKWDSRFYQHDMNNLEPLDSINMIWTIWNLVISSWFIIQFINYIAPKIATNS